MGVDQCLVSFLMGLHRGLTASICYGSYCECTMHFALSKEVRQGCILAPFLFTKYVNCLEKAILYRV